MRVNYQKLVISIVLPFLAGTIGSFFTYEAIPNWYASLDKPSFNPPNWIFGPVWTTLYIFMGVSLYLIWNHPTKKTKIKQWALYFFGIQLILNTLWSVIFFGLKNPAAAFIEICHLWVFILLTIVSFWKLDKTAAWLLIPYLGWVSFAAILNFYIMILN